MQNRAGAIAAFAMVVSVGLGSTASAQFLDRKALSATAAKRMAGACVAAIAQARTSLTVAVVDDAGNLIYLERMDGAGFQTADIAKVKAYTALVTGKPSKALKDEVAAGDLHSLALHDRIPYQGGLPIMVGGQKIGAIAGAGAGSELDEQCARVGLDSIGVK
jgi:uncharacterized protein GlcG (DUF336 family)